MESHAVAEIAVEHAVPFVVVRVIADPLTREIPLWLGGVIGPDGSPQARAVLKGLLVHPADLMAIVRLAPDARRAMTTLSRVAARAGPFFHFHA
jgi:adenosylhomocysteine nucleosidase